MRVIIKSCLLLFFVFAVSTVNAQKFNHYKKFSEFKEADLKSPPPENSILLIGSSSFTFWEDVQDYFPEKDIINRGFGGSTILDLIYAYNDIVPLYKPKQIVIYCGENDLAFDENMSSCALLARFEVLYNMIRFDFGEQVLISYVSMKPSPARKHLMNRFEEGNDLIRQFLEQKKQANYINLFPYLLNKKGEPDVALYLDDLLHNNKKGYEVWKDVLEPFLVNTKE